MYFRKVIFEPVTWLLVGTALLLLSVFVMEAEAIGNDEEDRLQKELADWKKKIVQIDKDILKQKTKINDLDTQLEEKKNELRELRKTSSDSWTAIQDIDKVVQDIAKIERDITSAKDQLGSLLDTKNRFNLKVADVEDQLHEIEPVPFLNTTEILNPIINNTEIYPSINSTDFQVLNNTKIVKYNPSVSQFLSDRNIGITLSKNCLTMIKHNITTTCPTYEDLITLDSSNPEISGGFSYYDGYFHREHTAIHNNWKWYDYDSQPRIFIDPPNGMQSRIKMIYLQPNFDIYLGLGSDSVLLEDGKLFRTVYHDRYVDKCKTATINADKWQILIADTIFYLRNDCVSGATTFNNMEIIVTNATEFDITTSQKWKDDQWISHVKEFCIFKYKAC